MLDTVVYGGREFGLEKLATSNERNSSEQKSFVLLPRCLVDYLDYTSEPISCFKNSLKKRSRVGGGQRLAARKTTALKGASLLPGKSQDFISTVDIKIVRGAGPRARGKKVRSWIVLLHAD